MEVYLRYYLDKGLVVVILVFLPGLFWGNPRSMLFSLLWVLFFLEQMLARGALRWSGVDFAMLMAVGLSGVAPWSTSCWWIVLRYARKVEAPFSTCGGINDRLGKDLCFDMHHRDGFAEDSGGDFRSMPA
jgi:hypothetical protein